MNDRVPKPHALGFAREWLVWKRHHFLVRDACRTIGYCRPDVFRCEVRVIFQKITLACRSIVRAHPSGQQQYGISR